MNAYVTRSTCNIVFIQHNNVITHSYGSLTSGFRLEIFSLHEKTILEWKKRVEGSFIYKF